MSEIGRISKAEVYARGVEVEVVVPEVHPRENFKGILSPNTYTASLKYTGSRVLTPRSQRKNRSLSRKLRKSLIVTPADPDQALTPLLSKQQANDQSASVGKAIGMALGLPAIPAFGIGAIISVASSIALSFHPGELAQFQQTMSILGPITGVSAILGGNLVWSAAKSRRSDNALYELAAVRFASWLWLRHKIKLNTDELERDRFFDMLVLGGGEFEKRVFTAEDGQQYALVMDEDVTFHIEQHLGSKKKAKRKKAKALAAAMRQIEAAAPFTGEASVLSAEVQALLVKLGKRDLGFEDTHVVRRAQEDLAQLAGLNANLHELDGPEVEQEAHFKEILLALRSELREVLTRQKALVAKDVRITAAYVRERQASTSRLELVRGEAAKEV